MKKIILLLLLFINAMVFANNENWRNLVIAQFREIAEPLFDHAEASKPQFDNFYIEMVEDFPIQQQAEQALEYAINRFVGASDYIVENIPRWKGEIKRNKKLDILINLSAGSPLIETRMAGFEIFLVIHNLDKSSEQIDTLIDKLEKKPKFKPWHMWTMATIAARGIERDRVFDELIYATGDADEENRRWAVDALSRFGGEEVVIPLLEIAQYDSSPIVQERAFCGLAQSGTLNIAERYSALPGLLKIAQDPYSNEQTLAWVYQALKEISHIYNIKNDPDLWQAKLQELQLVAE